MKLAYLANSGVSACHTVLGHTARVALHLINQEQNQQSVSDLTYEDIQISECLKTVTLIGIKNIVSFAETVSPCINVPDDKRRLMADAFELQTEIQRVNQIISQYEVNVIRLLQAFSNPPKNPAELVSNSHILSAISRLTVGHIAHISQLSTDLVSRAERETNNEDQIPFIPYLKKLFFIEPIQHIANKLQIALSQIGSSGPATAAMHPAAQASVPPPAGEPRSGGGSAPPGNLKDDSNY